MRSLLGILAALACGWLVPSASAGEGMPVERQNQLVQKYCAVCHTDANRSGGLSLEHFDAAHAAASLAAMMVSKLTAGVSLETAQAAASDPGAAAVVDTRMKTGAMGASGIPKPDQATIDALIQALASEATGAGEWHVDRSQDPATQAPVVTASILRELPAPRGTGETPAYRLVLRCNSATHEGEMQVAWAPAARTGELSAAADGKTPVKYAIAESAAVQLAASALPAQTLRIADLFPQEAVEFPFSELSAAARQSLAACFPAGYSIAP